MRSLILILSLTIVLSLACTYRSAGSQSAPVNGLAAQSTPTSAPTAGQDKGPCTLKIAPALKGLRLGMTSDEVLAMFPGSKDNQQIAAALKPTDELGVANFSLKPATYGVAGAFAEISGVTFTFFDGRLLKVYFSYNGPQPSPAEKFVAAVAQENNLPKAEQWEPYPGMDQMKVLKCTGFEVRAFSGGRLSNLNYVEAHDLEAEKKMQERENKLLAKPTP